MAAIACAVGARAQAPARLLYVVALDKARQPVSDLKASDLRLADDGKPQSIVSLQLNDTRTGARAQPPMTIILFDLLNNNLLDRNYVAGTILRALEQAEDPGSIYLYILTTEGTLYAVRGLSPPGTAATDKDWALNAKTLIDNALNQVFGIGPLNKRFEGNREALTFQTLHDVASALAVFPGRKSVVWSTRGFPAVGFTALVRQVGAEMDQAGIALYAVDESASVTTVLARSMLEELTGATGGKVYEAGQTPRALGDASAEMRLYYTLSYQPMEKNWNGKFHKVKLTCVRKDVQIRAEDGYVANVPTPHQEARY
jgi:VWFA-related protein